jgi:hypothetical protein
MGKSRSYVLYRYQSKCNHFDHSELPSAAMKLLLFALLSCSLLVFAGLTQPVQDGELISSSSLSERNDPDCSFVGTALTNLVSGGFVTKIQIVWVTIGSGITFNVCRIVSHYVGDQPCTAYSSFVALAVYAIFLYSQRRASQRTGTEISARDLTQISASDMFADALSVAGFDWAHVETPTIERRDNDTNSIVDHFIFRNVAHSNLSIIPADYHFKTFTDGTGYLHAIHSTADGNVEERSGRRLGKRHDGAGFKYNFNTVYYDSAVSGPDLGPQFLQAAQSIAQNWAYDADGYGIGQYFVVTGLDYILLKLLGNAIRIIPELYSFGEEYEDVNTCGNLVDYVQQELK